MGLVQHLGTVHWIYHSMYVYGGMSLALSVAVVLLLCAYLALYPAVFAWVLTKKLSCSRLSALLLGPPLWVLMEYLRGHLLTGFPWTDLGGTQWRWLGIIQVADLTGHYGVSYLVVGVNFAAVELRLLKRRLRQMPLFPLSYTVLGYALLLLALGGALLYGIKRLGEPLPRGSRSLRVAIVQANVEQSLKWEPALAQRHLALYEQMSLAAARHRVQLIIWPETAYPYVLEEPLKEGVPPGLSALQERLGAALLLGLVARRQEGQLTNSALLLENGKAVFQYDKIHLVPFGEYVPLRRVLFFVNKLSQVVGNFSPGRDYSLATLRGHGKFAVLICYEDIFPGLVRKFFRRAGDFMVVLTNDGWFGTTGGPHQHLGFAALRAVENRKPLLRAANTGVSAVFDHTGRLLRSLPLAERGLLLAELRTHPGQSFYSQWGDIFVYLMALASLLMLLKKD
jgi:apolipoprotein N-acyltransferase